MWLLVISKLYGNLKFLIISLFGIIIFFFCFMGQIILGLDEGIPRKYKWKFRIAMIVNVIFWIILNRIIIPMLR